MPPLKGDPSAMESGRGEGSSTGTESVEQEFSYPDKEARNADINYIMYATGTQNPTSLLDMKDPDIRKAYLYHSGKQPGPYDKKDGRTSGRNIGGIIEDTVRGPIRYSKGGAVKGKTFRGSF